MIDSIVLELQRDALDAAVRVSDLLRKALVISRKLGLGEFGTWLDRELNGYVGKDTEIPDYRELHGEPRFWNPDHGWMPITFGPKATEIAEILSARTVNQRIAEIEDLVDRDDGSLTIPYTYTQQARIGEAIGWQSQSAMFVPKTGLIGIIDAVRNIILNWTLELEEKDVLGEGLTFTAAERKAAEQSSQQVNYYIGHIGGPAQFQQGGSGHQIQLNCEAPKLDEIASFVSDLSDQLGDLDVGTTELDELRSEIETLKAQVKSPRPKRTIIRESLESLRRILEGAAGGAAGQLLIQLGKLATGA